MSFEQQQPIVITRTAEADLRLLQYHFVKAGSSGGVVTCDTQGEDALGVLQNIPDWNSTTSVGGPAIVCIIGVTKLKAMAAIADGADIAVSDVTATEGEADTADSGEFVMGKSLHGQAAVAGDIITAAVNCVSNMLLP